MNTRSLLTLLALSTLIPQLSTAQGSLTPPAGPPAASMKTLDQVEARTPLVAGAAGVTVSAAGTITISQPGSYYLTKNVTITTAGAHGISVSSDNVTLDLGGFSLICTTVNGGSAVLLNATSSVRVHNGHVIGGTTVTGSTFTPAGWLDGLTVTSDKPNLSAADISVRGVRTTGINLRSENSRVERCSVDTVGGPGITGTCLSFCSAKRTGETAIATSINLGVATVDNCYGQTVSTFDFHPGISATTANVSNSAGISIAGRGLSAASASNCEGRSTSGLGLRADRASNCRGQSDSSFGLSADSAINCSGSSTSGNGLAADSATNCSGYSQSGTAVIADTASNCNGFSFGGPYGMDIAGTASFCRGSRQNGIAIRAAIAIGCTSDSGTITAPQKHLGTP
jgi:hypothetical protein